MVALKEQTAGLYARKLAEAHVVEGANHMSLYDVPKYVDEAVSVRAPFFKTNFKPLDRAQEAYSWAEYPRKEWQKRRSN